MTVHQNETSRSPGTRPPTNPRNSAAIFLPLALIAFAIIAVIAFWDWSGGAKTTTASQDSGTITSNAPKQIPPPSLQTPAKP